MYRAVVRPVVCLAPRTTSTRAGTVRASSSSPFPEDSPPPPPPPSYISAATIYPFILLSAITSLALNLSHQRTARETEGAQYRAQISVLETLLDGLRTPAATAAVLTEAQQEDIERELELVGLGRGKGKAAVDAEGGKRAETSWREVFLGKKGKGYEEEDTTDWEKVFHEADEADKARTLAARTRNAPPALTSPPASAPSAPPASPAPSTSSPPCSARPSRGIYL
ncbi:hypothetical protein JCM11641_000076 [Rhodosporidiobolus odoratus]